MSKGRRLAVAAVLVVLYLVVVAVVVWLLDRDVGMALFTAFMSCAAGSVGWVVGARIRRAAVTRGRLDVAVRSPDGHHLLSRRWHPAEVHPTGSGLRIFPQVGPSVAPFTIKAEAVEVLEAPRGWRDLAAVVSWPELVRISTRPSRRRHHRTAAAAPSPACSSRESSSARDRNASPPPPPSPPRVAGTDGVAGFDDAQLTVRTP